MESEVKLFSVFVSERAKQHIAEHVRFVAHVDKEAARNLKNCFVSAFRSLEKLPHRFPYFNEAGIPYNKYRKLLLEKHYLAFYQVQENYVFVDYIVDCRQEYMWLLRAK